MKLSRKSIFLLVIIIEISGLIVVSGLTINSKLNPSSLTPIRRTLIMTKSYEKKYAKENIKEDREQ